MSETVELDLNEAPALNRKPEATENKPQPAPEQKEFANIMGKTGDPAKRGVILKIQRYFQAFPSQTSSFRSKSLESMSVLELEKVLEEVRISVSTQNGGNFYKQMGLAGLNVLETVGSGVGLRLNGLTQSLAMDQAFDDIMKEISAEFGGVTYLKPQYRLLLLIGQRAYAIHALNSLTADQKTQVIQHAQEQVGNQSIPPATVAQYEDL